MATAATMWMQVAITMASTGWRRRVLEHLYDARGAVTVDDLARLLEAEPHRVHQLLLGLEEEWLALRQHRHYPGAISATVALTPNGRSYVERAYRSADASRPLASNG